jgi:hypothetical protein
MTALPSPLIPHEHPYAGETDLFSPVRLGACLLTNRIVMALASHISGLKQVNDQPARDTCGLCGSPG